MKYSSKSVMAAALCYALGETALVAQTINSPPVQPAPAVTNNWVDSISPAGIPHQSQPSFAALSGSAACAQLPAWTGSVTTSAGSCATAIASGAVAFSNFASAALATAAQYMSGAANVVIPASVIYTSEVTVTFGATTTFDFSTFINSAVTLTGNITTMSVANVKAGQAGTIAFIQDSTGSRTTVWNSVFKFAGGITPTLSTGANDVDILSYSCRSATFCVASLIANVH